MDHNYGVVTQNKFSLFYDEETDPNEAIAKAEEARAAKKKDDGDKKSSKSKQKKVAAPEVKKAPEQPAFKKDGKYSLILISHLFVTNVFMRIYSEVFAYAAFKNVWN